MTIPAEDALYQELQELTLLLRHGEAAQEEMDRFFELARRRCARPGVVLADY